MSASPAPLAVVGGGIVGLATARELLAAGRAVVVLEAEDEVGRHQTGHNSGVVHSGLYYRPGSLKARFCTEGREALHRFCTEEGLPVERCGKVVVATRPEELPALEELERRGHANGLQGLRRLAAEEIREVEPHVAGLRGLWVAETGITDFGAVARALARRVAAAGGEVRTGARLTAVRTEPGGLVLETSSGDVRAAGLVNCAGLHADRVARLCGVDPGVRIVPFRGEYCELVPEREHLVRGLVYPVPDPRFPFLGVHFTRMVGGGVEAGPSAVLALRREGYGRASFSAADVAEMVSYGGFWRMGRTYWRLGTTELARSVSTRGFVRAMRKLVPEVRLEDVRRGGSGVRAQAVGPRGELLDDFHVVEGPRSVHVVNAPSPAATASLPIGRHVAALAVAALRT